jgi:predicted ATPase
MNSLVEMFSINGLYGYKNIKLQMHDSTTIVVSENGVGKTTLLNALNQILNDDLKELSALDFKNIIIKFRGFEQFVFNKEDIVERSLKKTNELYSYVSSYLSEESFWHEIRRMDLNSADIEGEPLVKLLELHSPYSLTHVVDLIDNLKGKSALEETPTSLKFMKIRELVNNTQIVYLPTYRRVEKSELKDMRRFRGAQIEKDDSKRFAHPRQRKMKEIEFGLADVEHKLKAMSEDVERQSNIGYRSLSASMLDDLLSGMETTGDIKLKKLPDIEDLERFLLRVASRGQKHRLNATLKEIHGLYETGKITEKRQLAYFLTKLNNIINLTKEKELMIEQFVNVCNKYLSVSSDSKILTFDARSLMVVVNDEFTSKPIKLDDLSSGEKQIISLMSHLYLDDVKKIILIDEPELSLSLEWQRMVLPDIDASPNVAQIIAITHSPFIFDNRLSSNAVMLDIAKVR